MKNKSFTYVLLAVVALIWYQVFFRVKGNLFGDNQEIVSPIEPNASFSPIVRDTFALLANYRDPFGLTKKTNQADNHPSINNYNTARPIERVRPPQFTWPPIQYFGMVKKTDSKNPLAIITIDGIQLMGRKGEELFDEIILKTIYRDSVLIVYKNKKKYFLRN